MGLFRGVVGLGESFGDDKFGHIDFVLEEIGDGVFDVAERKSVTSWTLKKKKGLTPALLGHPDL